MRNFNCIGAVFVVMQARLYPECTSHAHTNVGHGTKQVQVPLPYGRGSVMRNGQGPAG